MPQNIAYELYWWKAAKLQSCFGASFRVKLLNWMWVLGIIECKMPIRTLIVKVKIELNEFEIDLNEEFDIKTATNGTIKALYLYSNMSNWSGLNVEY